MEEMEELNSYFNQLDKVKGPGLLIDKEIRDTIFEFTGGHIGLISKIYDNIIHQFRNSSPNKKSVTKQEIFHYFYSSENFKALETYRSFNGITKLKEEQKELLRKLFFARVLHVTDFPEKDLSDFLKMGIIDYTRPNSKEVTWSFEMMRTYLMAYLFSANKRPLPHEFEEKYKGSMNAFIWDALERFSPKQLKDGIGKETKYLREQHVVVEFYRVISSLVPKTFSILFEYGKDVGVGAKRIDTYINDNTQWPIEFVTETNDVPGHAEDFEHGGSYKNAKKKNHAVIHFVSHHKKDHDRAKEVDGVWRVELDVECNTAQVSPWIRKDSNDVGHRGEKTKIFFKGDLDHYPLDKHEDGYIF